MNNLVQHGKVAKEIPMLLLFLLFNITFQNFQNLIHFTCSLTYLLFDKFSNSIIFDIYRIYYQKDLLNDFFI